MHGIIAANCLDRGVGEARRARIDAFHGEGIAGHRRDFVAARKAQLVKAFVARDNQRAPGAEPRHRSGIDRHIGGTRDADQLAGDLGRIRQRAHQVEDRALTDPHADGLDARHRRVVVLGEEKADADLGEGLFRGASGGVHVEAERFERVCRPRLGRSGAVAVLGDRHAAGRDHEAYGGRDVERVVPVAACAADVDRAFGGFNRDEPRPQGPRGARDFVRGLAAC